MNQFTLSIFPLPARTLALMGGKRGLVAARRGDAVDGVATDGAGWSDTSRRFSLPAST